MRSYNITIHPEASDSSVGDIIQSKMGEGDRRGGGRGELEEMARGRTERLREEKGGPLENTKKLYISAT